MTTQPNRAARRQADRNGSGPAADEVPIEYKVDCLIWLLAEERLRTIRLAQAVASLLVQAAQPQITNQLVGQLLNPEQPLQGAPPVMPMMPPGA